LTFDLNFRPINVNISSLIINVRGIIYTKFELYTPIRYRIRSVYRTKRQKVAKSPPVGQVSYLLSLPYG